MSTIFDNSLLIKAINDECKNLKCSKKKNPVKDKEKNIKPIFTAKERKKGENILQADNRSYLKGRKLEKEEHNFITCYYFFKRAKPAKNGKLSPWENYHQE